MGKGKGKNYKGKRFEWRQRLEEVISGPQRKEMEAAISVMNDPAGIRNGTGKRTYTCTG
jgi:hypothetical protein